MYNYELVSFLNLKPLTPDLLPAAVELDRICFGGLWTIKGYERELERPSSDLLVLIPGEKAPTEAEEEKQATKNSVSHPPIPPSPHPPLLGLGCLWAILEEAHITMLAVDPKFRRQGFGQVLLLSLLASAKQRGLERATLEVKVSNQAALSLYEKFGFRVAGRRRGYYQDTGEDALILWLSGMQYPEFRKNLANWEKQIRSRLASHGYGLQLNLVKH